MRPRASLDAKRVGLLDPVRALWGELKGNRRALAGALAIFGILAVYGLLRLDDVVATMRGSYVQEISLLRRTTAMGEEKDWPKRAKDSAEIRHTLESRLWNFESEGVALANLQDWVTGAGRDAKLDRLQVRIEVARPKDLPSNVRQITATISAMQDEASLMAFLGRIQKEPHLLVVDKLHVQQRPVPSLTMTLITYVTLGGAPGFAAK